MNNFPKISVVYGTPELFLKIMMAIAYLTRHHFGRCNFSSAIRSRKYRYQPAVMHHQEYMQKSAYILATAVVEKFDPSAFEVKTNFIDKKKIASSFIIPVSCDNVIVYFPSARERMSIVNWLYETLIQANIDVALLDNLLEDLKN